MSHQQQRRLYLAGPDVFFPDPYALAEEKKKRCQTYGFEGVFPLDSSLDLSGCSPTHAGLAIAQANERLMRSCDGLIANMTPFRGPGMDGGTAYEMGFMRALGKPVFGYTLAPKHGLDFAARTKESLTSLSQRADGQWCDHQGLLIEDFALPDNLMMAAAVLSDGKTIYWDQDLTAFDNCLVQASCWPWEKDEGMQ